MRRHYLALLGTAAAYFYLQALLVLLIKLAIARSKREWQVIPDTLLDGTFHLILYAIPVLLFIGLAARSLTRNPLQSGWKAALVGALLGSGLAVLDTFRNQFFSLESRIVAGVGGLLAGLICGLIYSSWINQREKPAAELGSWRHRLDTAKRISVAAVLANFAAPFLAGGFWLLTQFGDTTRGLSAKNFFFVAEGVVQMFATGVNVLTITLFPITLLAALVGQWAGLRSRWVYILGGVLFGLLPAVLISSAFPQAKQGFFALLIIAMLPAGALCGWIYWRIAIGGQTENPML